MSPEQCWNEPVDARATSTARDFFVLLTGRAVPAAHDLQVMFAHCNDPVLEPGPAARFAEACARSSARRWPRAADRYQTRGIRRGARSRPRCGPEPVHGRSRRGDTRHSNRRQRHADSERPTREATRALSALTPPDAAETTLRLARARRGWSRRILLWRNTRPHNPPGRDGHAGGTGPPPPVPVFVPAASWRIRRRSRGIGRHALARGRAGRTKCQRGEVVRPRAGRP